jgi:hypothetical protein
VPGRVWFWMVGWIVFGWLCYFLAYCYGLLTPVAGSRRDLAFLQLLIFAVDKFLPGGELVRAGGWQVDPTSFAASFFYVFERAYRLVGWFFTALAAAALVGLLKKE